MLVALKIGDVVGWGPGFSFPPGPCSFTERLKKKPRMVSWDSNCIQGNSGKRIVLYTGRPNFSPRMSDRGLSIVMGKYRD